MKRLTGRRSHLLRLLFYSGWIFLLGAQGANNKVEKTGQYYWIQEQKNPGQMAASILIGPVLKIFGGPYVDSLEWTRGQLFKILSPITPHEQGAKSALVKMGVPESKTKEILDSLSRDLFEYLQSFKKENITLPDGKVIKNPHFRLFRGELSSEVWLNAIHNFYPKAASLISDTVLQDRYPYLSADQRSKIIAPLRDGDPKTGTHITLNHPAAASFPELLIALDSEIIPKTRLLMMTEAVGPVTKYEMQRLLGIETTEALERLTTYLYKTDLQSHVSHHVKSQLRRWQVESSTDIERAVRNTAEREVLLLASLGGWNQLLQKIFPKSIPPALTPLIGNLEATIRGCTDPLPLSTAYLIDVRTCIVSALMRQIHLSAPLLLEEAAKQRFSDPSLIRMIREQSTTLDRCLKDQTLLRSGDAYSRWIRSPPEETAARRQVFLDFLDSRNIDPSFAETSDRKIKDVFLQILSHCFEKILEKSLIGTLDFVVEKNPWLKDPKFEPFLSILKDHPAAFVGILRRETLISPLPDTQCAPGIDTKLINKITAMQDVLNTIIDHDQALFANRAEAIRVYLKEHPKDASFQEIMNTFASDEVLTYIAIAFINDHVVKTLKDQHWTVRTGRWLGTVWPEDWGGLPDRFYDAGEIDFSPIFKDEAYAGTKEKILKAIRQLTQLSLPEEKRAELITEIRDIIIRDIYKKDPKDFK